jgi:hypothetical protein
MTPMIQKMLYMLLLLHPFQNARAISKCPGHTPGALRLAKPRPAASRPQRLWLHLNILPAATWVNHNPGYLSRFSGSVAFAGGGVTAGFTPDEAGGTPGPGEGAACIRG